MTRPTIRVLVIEDSVTVRKRICEVLGADSAFEVVGEAGDGKRGIELCATLKPDLIMMDMMLPVMNGLAATEYIMAHHPTPILIVSSSTNRGDLFKTYDALAAGAVDVLEKPSGDELDGVWEAKLVALSKLVARIKVITHLRARIDARSSTIPPNVATPLSSKKGVEVVIIGASTGGPSALVTVLRSLPHDFALPILVVLHIGESFGHALADWLDSQSNRRVAYAEEGVLIADQAGTVMMAPPDYHMVVREGRVHLNRDPERHSCRPSVDVLFESAARYYGGSVAACLLTGMGRDGALGMKDVRQSGGVTIAQNEASSVIYGMPREAFLIGGVEHVLPLDQIGPCLATLTRRRMLNAP